MTAKLNNYRTFIDTVDITPAGNRLLLSVAVQRLVRQGSNNLNGSSWWKRQWVNTATEKQQPERYAQAATLPLTGKQL
jgi:hypothetical protein